MPAEVINLHIGQTGNHVGNLFWKSICEEHRVNFNGETETRCVEFEKLDTFFSEAPARFIPRSILGKVLVPTVGKSRDQCFFFVGKTESVRFLKRIV
jgi:hypothetical protein